MLPAFVVLSANILYCLYLLTSWPLLVFSACVHVTMLLSFFILPHMASAGHDSTATQFGGILWALIYLFTDITTAMRDTGALDRYVFYAFFAILLLIMTFVIISLSCHTLCRNGDKWEEHVVELCSFVWFCTRNVNPTLRIFSLSPILGATAIYAVRDVRHVFLWACIICVEIFASYDASCATYMILSALFAIGKYGKKCLYIFLVPLFTGPIILYYVSCRFIYTHDDTMYYLTDFIRNYVMVL